jgi:peptidoglycan/LPS O-acetylase OafA/YrhL
MTTALMLMGGLLVLIGGIIIAIAAFQESFVWGLAVVVAFVPVGLLYAFTHWEDTRKAFALVVAGAVLIIAGVMLGGGREAQNLPGPGERPRGRQMEIPD